MKIALSPAMAALGIFTPLWAPLSALLSQEARACPCHTNAMSAEQTKKLRERVGKEKPRRIPAASASGMPVLPTNWGGSDLSRHRPEAILANATSQALNHAWSLPDTRDAVVAVPVKMLRSDFHPYGDGQTNAVASFGKYWKGSAPPVVVTRIVRDSGTLVRFQLDGSLKLGAPNLNLRIVRGARVDTVPLKRTDSEMPWIAEWKPADALDAEAPFWIQPEGWNDGFPVVFRHPVYPIETMRGLLPESMRKIPSTGGAFPDPERIRSEQGARTPFEALVSHRFSGAFNQNPYNPKNIHAEYPGPGGIATGVGEGWTWVAEKPQAPFKTLYTCFERRNPDREARSKDGGVASGGGWHEIGDPAETILNSLENQPVVVGWGTRSTIAPPTAAGYSYELSDVVTVRWLKPGEAMMTAAGDFHWFYFHWDREVCTEEWVHPCVPGPANHFGFQCM